MLAERRKKVIYSNPRGTLWANDKQKFGQRMLESMGWQEGNGLGKNKNGITENVKASFKFDNKGFGFKTKATDWIEDNNVYEQILSDLSKYHKVDNKTNDINGDNSESNKQEQFNIELKTKSSNRLHYKKFIKAKNLSIKSKDDLYCIFPTKKFKKSEEEPTSIESSSSNDNNSKEQEKESITVESKLSVQDYFQQKMKEKLKRSSESISNTEIKSNNFSNETPITEKKLKKRKHKNRQ